MANKIFTKAREAEMQKLFTQATEAVTILEAAAEKYNEAMQSLRAFRDEVVEQIETIFDEKSEKWQESDKGTAWSEWMDQWKNHDFDDITIEELWSEETAGEDLPTEPATVD